MASSACDQCHRLKIKCTPAPQGCARCSRLRFSCTLNRAKQKRGRKPTRFGSASTSPLEGNQTSSLPIYPVLDELLPAEDSGNQNAENSILGFLSRESASQLLDHFYSSPNQEFHTRIIRRRNLLDLENPRPTSPAFLLSILCLACSMPNDTHSPILPSKSNEELASILERLFTDLVMQFQHITRFDRRPSLDDAITAYNLTSLAPTQKSPLVNLVHWMASLNYMVKKLNLLADNPEVSMEQAEERRRLWWATYIFDKHAALSFNLRCQVTDLECRAFPLPCPDTFWESMTPLSDFMVDETEISGFLSYSVDNPDLFGLLIPLCRILGEILEYHFIRHHSTLNVGVAFLHDIRTNIQSNLKIWHDSLDAWSNVVKLNDPITTAIVPGLETAASHDKVVLYALHIYHCMHILLYGQIDLVNMYNDTEWQYSPDFVKTGEHAISCAQVSNKTLTIDPHLDLMHHFFGTYLLQSSFIFLILARKLGESSDIMVYENCHINLRVLDVFTRVTNRPYQSVFADALRKSLLGIIPGSYSYSELSESKKLLQTEISVGLEPELLKYRWVAGYNGLWATKIPLEP